MGKAGFIKRRLKAEEAERAKIAAEKRTVKPPKPPQQLISVIDPKTQQFIDLDLNQKRFDRKKPIGGEPILRDGNKNILNAAKLKDERKPKRNLIPLSEVTK